MYSMFPVKFWCNIPLEPREKGMLAGASGLGVASYRIGNGRPRWNQGCSASRNLESISNEWGHSV